MLTEGETQVLNWIYSMSCKFPTIPFKWKNNRMYMKRPSHLFNYGVWILTISRFCFQFKQMSVMTRSTDINGMIPFAILHLFSGGHIIVKFIISIFKVEFAELINDILRANSNWGKLAQQYQLHYSRKAVSDPKSEGITGMTPTKSVGHNSLALVTYA